MGLATEQASVRVYADQVLRRLQPTLFGVNVSYGDKPHLAKPELLARVMEQGYTSFRFPNGCQADLYNWKSPKPAQVTVDEFLDFCAVVGGEAYYTLNLQGGTEGLEGAPPEGVPLDERIRYRHTAPNPCGYTDYHFGTLSEARELFQKYTIERALDGKPPMLHYEMGNENWGQAFTDWPPEVYAKTIEVYARALRSDLAEAAAKHPELAKLKLWIVAVGFPVMGNNMKLADTPDRRTNVAWTRLLNDLHEQGVIDAVQEHFYPYASANGGALAWAAHNLQNIQDVRRGVPNPRLNGYRDRILAYNMPMEHTEWNIKCWGPQFVRADGLDNMGFEDGLQGWAVSGDGASVSLRAARRGDRGIRIRMEESGAPVEIARRVTIPEDTRIVTAAVWVRADDPQGARLIVRDAAGKEIGGFGATTRGSWERVISSARTEPGTKEVEIAMRVSGRGTAYLDEVMVYTTKDERGHGAMSAVTFEQPLFAVDALRAMAEAGCPRAHLHHIIGGYPCGAMNPECRTKDLGRAFEFWNGMYGESVLRCDVNAPAFSYASAGNAWATDFNALAPDREDVPMLSALATRTGRTLFLLLLNRTSDRTISVSVDAGAEPAAGTADARTLSGTDIDLPGAELSEGQMPVARRFSVDVQPYSARIVRLELR